MDLFSKCKELYEKIRYFEYGIPVDGVIKNVPSAEYYVKNYRFLKPEEFEKYKGGICWDYVEYERKFLEVNDIDFNQYYLITNTPPNYDTHTFITVKDGDELIYIESSFKRVEHIIDGVQKFKSLEDIVKLITTNMWYCNDNDKHFDEFKYDVCKFKGHPQYGCTCEEYMKWMDDNSDIVIQDVSINPKKVNEDELAVEEFTVNKVDTKFTQFVCESANDPEEYDETLHDHIADEDDVYNEASVLKFPKKVNNVPFDIMYFGSNIDFGNESIKLDHNELFLTPYIGLASIFITDRKEYFKPLPKDRPAITNIGYDEWGLSPSELQKPLKEVHVSLDDIPNVTPFEFDYTGYIYAIDVSQYKNNLYQKDWMTSDREFILKDVNPVPIKEKIKWTHHVYVRGKKNTDDVYNESWTDFKNGVHPSSGLMFHVSLKNDMDGKTINPQLPSYITDGGKLDDNYQEDTKTKRLCVSPSIEGCLIAILNYNKIREHVGDKFYVYTPEKPFSQYKHKTNKEIVKDKLVFDANITKEAWILEPCKLKLYGIIKLKKVKDLKKKPTVEKNIKMNTIKLDYEWIMTPKASGKFNKAIGDSPDKEDTKEKPIKEYDNILVSNDEFFMESQITRETNLKRLGYDPKTQTIDTRVKDVKTGKNIRIKLEIRDTKEEVYLDLTDSHDAIDFYDFINKSKIVIKRKFLNMKNNSAIGMIFHEVGHLIDIIDSKFKNHLSDKDQITMKRLKEYVHKNLNTAGLSDHDAHEREHIADGFGATKTSYHTMNKSISKNTKGDKNKIYSVYKKLLVDYRKLSNRIKQLNLPPENELVEEIQEMKKRLEKLEFPDNFWDDDYDPEEEALNFEKVKEIEELKFGIEKKFNLYKNYLNKNALEKSLKVTYPNDKIHKQRGPAERSRMTRNSSDYANIGESCLIMDNDEFFMEASKNPDVKDLESAESKDIYHNIDLWESGKCNLMWVTGLSGSGKSTIAKEIANVNKAEHIELDDLQRAKLSNWKSTGSKMLDDYIKSKGGLSKIFPYVNDMEKPSFRDLVLNEGCAEQFNDLIKYIISYAKSHRSHKYTVEGVQLAFYATDDNINAISQYPVVIKMTGPFKAEIRRIQRLIKNKIEFKEIFKQVSKRMSNMMKEGFYKSDYKKIKDFKSNIGESCLIMYNEEFFDLTE